MEDNLVSQVDLSKWKKMQEIIFELHSECGITIDSREWRIAVEKWNQKFSNGEVDFYVTHSNSQGYKATKDYQEAKLARNDYLKRAFNMLKKARSCDKAFGELSNLKFDLEEGEII